MSATEKHSAKPTLIVGGTGKTGRRVAEQLWTRGHSVRIGSRAATPVFDWENASTWGPALDGVGAVYLTYYPDLAAPGADRAIEAFVAEALKRDVRRIVLLSGRGEPEAQVCEDILIRSDADWTIVRASWFAQNFSENFMAEGVLGGELVLPATTVAEPFIDVDDIASVAVAALTEEGHVGQLYEVTGPRLLTFAEAVSEIAQACGRPIAYVEIPLEVYVAAMKGQGAPGDFVDLVAYLFGTVLDGRNASLADGVKRALGREPKDFRDWARETAASGVWNASAAA